MPSNLFRRHSSRRKGYRSKRRRNRKLLIAAAVIVVLSALGLFLWDQGMFPANQAAEDWYEIKSEQVAELVQLPQDDAAHDSFMEWWYYNGHLATDSGDRYNFHFAFFVVNTIVTQSVAHVSLLDQQTGGHYTDQKLTPGKPSNNTENGFDFGVEGWQMVGGDGNDRLSVSTSDFRINLRLKDDSPAMLHGGLGLLDFELAGTSYYYSRPRMKIQGEIEVAGAIKDVTGLAWFDHQWGDFDVNKLGWDWFALQMDDGTDIMIYLLFDSSGLPVLRTATITQDGTTKILTATDFEVEATDRWVSKQSGIEYPMGWDVKIPTRKMELTLKPITNSSEFDSRATTNKVYWEGAIEIVGTHTGKGFVEMSGYKKIETTLPPSL